jgi:hypothetical protein
MGVSPSRIKFGRAPFFIMGAVPIAPRVLYREKVRVSSVDYTEEVDNRVVYFTAGDYAELRFAFNRPYEVLHVRR